MFEIDDEEERIIENIKLQKKLNADSSLLTLKMIAELSRLKNTKLKGKDVMSFDDF